MMTALGMVRAGIGLAVLPASAREIAAEPAVRSRRINDPNFSHPVALIKKAGRTLPPLSLALAEFLSENRRMLVAKAAARPRK
jgi:DNA-binding transcriptional LysR family regulator